MQISLLEILLGALFSGSISLLAYKFHVLSLDGAIAACIVGTVVFGIGGLQYTFPMLTFFATSSALSKLRKSRKSSLGYAKAGPRDAAQVFANGGVAVICTLLPLAGIDKSLAYTAFLASLAAANADTWATEIGSATGGKPYHIIKWKQVAPGMSGAVSIMGTVAMCCGAILLALWSKNTRMGIVVCTSGICGAILDSIAGATIQAQWRVTSNDKSEITRNNNTWNSGEERYIEHSTDNSKPDLGVRFCTNEAVNLICTISAAIIATII